MIYTYYFCESCGLEWKNKSDFIRYYPECNSDNIFISYLTDIQPENIEEK